MADDDATVVARVRAATVPRTESDDPVPARFALELHPYQDPVAVGAEVEHVLADLRARVFPLSALDPEVLILDLLGRALAAAQPAACFAAGYALAERFDLVGAEPDLPTAFFPEHGAPQAGAFLDGAMSGFPPGCWVEPEPALEATPAWAIDRMHVPAAWVFSEQSGRPSRGEDIIVAQPDTGITPHVELVGVAFVPGFDVIDDDNDPTDPLTEPGNPGHGTGTASVLVSPDSYVVTGSAPAARLMPIRTIESVVRIRQITVARAIDWAIQEGAHVVTMSLGGIPASALHRAISRAVEADIIVLAAAGNCVRLVVWPARYDECIAVAATNAADKPWPGTCRGAPVDISAPGQNVYRAVVPPGGPTGGDTVGQGQGTSFAVALTAGVAALWVAHHGRANVVAAAHAHGETVQAMFRRLLQSTARRPTPWDAQAMGPGIVDARALLEASLDLGLDRESANLRTDARASAPSSVASLAAEAVGADAASDDALDWHRFGPELATALLSRQLPGQRAEVPLAEQVSQPLARSVNNPRLRDWLGLDHGPAPEAGTRVRNRDDGS
jgi:serine protease